MSNDELEGLFSRALLPFFEEEYRAEQEASDDALRTAIRNRCEKYDRKQDPNPYTGEIDENWLVLGLQGSSEPHAVEALRNFSLAALHTEYSSRKARALAAREERRSKEAGLLARSKSSEVTCRLFKFFEYLGEMDPKATQAKQYRRISSILKGAIEDRWPYYASGEPESTKRLIKAFAEEVNETGNGLDPLDPSTIKARLKDMLAEKKGARD